MEPLKQNNQKLMLRHFVEVDGAKCRFGRGKTSPQRNAQIPCTWESRKTKSTADQRPTPEQGLSPNTFQNAWGYKVGTKFENESS